MVDFLTEGPLYTFKIGTLDVNITKPMILMFAVMIVLCLLMIWLGSNLEVIPKKKKQIVSESIYGFISNLITSNIGQKYIFTVPLLGTMFVFIVGMNVVGLLGLKPPTTSFGVSMGFGVCAFIMIHAIAIKFGGVGGYIKSYAKPMPLLLPITLMERFIFPLSLTLRLFGNILAATVVMGLLYSVLLKLAYVGALVLPIPFSLYFDVFDGFLQGFIFTLLTMIQIKLISEEASEKHE